MARPTWWQRRDSLRMRVLRALRAGAHDSQQLEGRFGRTGVQAAWELCGDGLATMSNAGGNDYTFYRITPAGRTLLERQHEEATA